MFTKVLSAFLIIVLFLSILSACDSVNVLPTGESTGSYATEETAQSIQLKPDETAAVTEEMSHTSSDETIPSQDEEDHMVEVLQYYITYLEQLNMDFTGATEKYVHYENLENLELAYEHPDYINSYEIIRCEKLSDQLWVIEWFMMTDTIELGGYGAHYVGVIDGEYRVMINDREIPSELKENITIEPYIPHGPGIIGAGDVPE